MLQAFGCRGAPASPGVSCSSLEVTLRGVMNMEHTIVVCGGIFVRLIEVVRTPGVSKLSVSF